MATGLLASPVKVAVSDDGQRLAIADTGHDQVLVCLVDGLLLSVHTGFNRPQGVRFDGDDVVVCDTGANRVVRTTGEVLADDVSSPMDIVSAGDGGWLVAEAGRHRIVRIRPWEHQARPAAGSGTEGLQDGPWHRAQLVAPAGLARSEEGGVIVADPRSGALRLVASNGDVTTLLGPDGDIGQPLGVAAQGERIFVADSAGSELWVWDGGTLRTLPVELGLSEPGGMDVLPDGRLVVADTGNDRVVIVDPSDSTARELSFDESWVTSGEGAHLTARVGETAKIPFEVYLAGEELDRSEGPPVKVTVEARPRSLLYGGQGEWEVAEKSGWIEARAGERLEGSGLLLVEVTARTRAVQRGSPAVRVFRRRHRFAVS